MSNFISNSGRHVIQVTEGVSSDLGGTTLAVCQLSNYMASQGWGVTLLGLRNHSSKSNAPSLHSNIQLKECDVLWSQLKFSLHFSSVLSHCMQPNLIHIHGLWLPHYIQAFHYAERLKAPVVVSIHGMLDSFALGRNRIMKQAARILYQDRLLSKAQCLHVTSQRETDTLRELGFHNPIAMIPWGVPILLERIQGQQDALVTTSIPKQKRVALFLSRLHPNKGLDLLLMAWSKVCGEFPEWILVIAGYDRDGYQSKMLALARNLGIENHVVFFGPVHGSDKEAVFARSELMILPSRSESFGFVIAEALTRGIPVITTQETPWSSLVDAEAGWWVKPEVEALAFALRNAFRKNSQALNRMGKNGKALIEQHFSMESSGQRMMDLYRWVLGQNSKPSFVQEVKR